MILQNAETLFQALTVDSINVPELILRHSSRSECEDSVGGLLSTLWP